MNRSKRSVNNRLGKKMQKAVRDAKKETLSSQSRADSDQLTAQELLKKFPKKKIAPLKKKFPAKVKKTSQESKRTTPGLVSSDSTPSSPKREGRVWIKTVVKQSVASRKNLNKKLSKRK